ncbi:MAG: insulinase family protein, partial [Acutalibacteraceae bacterium]
MKINDRIHGFRVTRIRPVKELEAEMVEMTFEKNGAKLVWLKRDDTNKTFAITFRTTPEDDTGVFHILEHSVLCGSEKYPLKEPFVDLLKGSMQTFLNAMTFLDKTMYPVASRNNKDFLNLIDVYMDAVLHPLIYKKKEIFMQEGWHFEENDGELSYNGVVYNEMQGVFSSVENRFIYELLPRLYPNTCYGHCSGGNPKYIPNLTYEGFIQTHKRFYHPSNSTVFLDGDVDLESVLALLESYLADYEKAQVNTEIAFQPAVNAGTVTVPYEACESDGVFGKTEIAKGFVAAPFNEREKIMALGILADTLCATNESPLKKALLDEKLAEDVVFETDDASKQCTLYLVLRGVKDENVQKAEETVRKVFS